MPAWTHGRSSSLANAYLLLGFGRRRARATFLSIILLVSAGFFIAHGLTLHTPATFIALGSESQRLFQHDDRLQPEDARPDSTKPRPQPQEWGVQNDVIGKTPLPDHNWHVNGLLTVNFGGAHPIYELMDRAELAWEEKHKRASTTLESAVEEYQRRYKRAPPLGFDHWWNYVVKHDVRLPDEYDQIYHDLEPYWGVDPADLQAGQSDWEAHPDTWTIGKATEDFSTATLLNTTLSKERADQFLRWGARQHLELMGDLWQHVPPFRATFNVHDGPNTWTEWTWKAAALEAAKEGTHIKRSNFPPQDKAGWATMCPPGSPLHDDPPPIGSWPTPQADKTFIHDHRAAMDVCQHPQHLLLHGSFLGSFTDPRPARFPGPHFSNCATSLHGDIRGMSIQGKDEFVVDDPPWDQKDDDRLAWWGSPTGMSHDERANATWRNSHRVRLVSLAANSPSDFSETVAEVLQSTGGPDEPVGEPLGGRRSTMNNAMMNMGFAGNDNNCQGALCDVMKKEFAWKNYASQKDLGSYKYLFDVDGNGWSSRFRRLMSTHALVFKATVFPEWFMDRIQPWVHYIPVQLDYSDLYDSLTFFAGDYRNRDGAHDEKAKQIGLAGRNWVANYWRREDMTAYMFRLWLEYARVMSVDRTEMNFRLPDDV